MWAVLEKRCTFAQIYVTVEQFIINHLITFIAMRKIFTLLVMCLLASAAWADDITFVAGTDNGDSPGTAQAFTIEKSGIKIAVSNGLANATQYRVYKNQTMTITSTIGDIVKIEVECTANGDAQYGPGCFTVAPAEYTYDGKIGTWNGGATEVVFTASANQVRMTKITVTVGKAGLAAPSFDPAAGTYYDPIQVKISCPTQDAKIYYTTNGSNPTTSSTQYTAPISLSANTTVKAISAKDGEVSDVVVAEYVFGTAKPVSNIAAYAAEADETVVKFQNAVNAIAQNGRYLYVKDNSGYGLFYGSTDQSYTLGDVIPAGFVGTKTTYSGEPELANLSGFEAATGNVEIKPESITTANVDHAHWAHYVYFESATIDPEAKTLTDAVGTAPVYFSMGVTAAQIVAGTEYEVWAVIGTYQPKDGDVVYQILPIKVKRKGPGGVGIGTMGDYADNTMLTFEYDATVLYHGNSRLFVKDETGCGLIYGNVGQTYKQGDIIPAGYGGKKTTYGGEPELAATFSGFLPASGNVTVVADPATPLDVNHENFAHYVVMENVTISEVSGNNFKITDANGNTCNGFNQFGQDVQEGFYPELYGIVGSYGATNTVYQLLPIIPTKPVPVKSINELYELNKGKQGEFTTPLTAIYQNGANLYVQDAEGTQTLVYGGVPGTFTNGDIINGAIATWTEYQGANQMIPVDNFVVAGQGNKINPDEPMPIEEISQDMVHRYLSFEDVNLITEEDKIFIVDETGQLHLFDKFSVMPENLNYDETHYIEGFLTVYKGELEFYPILIDGDEPDCGIKGDVNNDKEINIADVNALLDIILGAAADDCTRWRADINGDGEIGLADVNALTDAILSH